MKKIKKYSWYIIIIIVGVIDCIFGFVKLYQKFDFIAKAKKTTADIYEISNNKKNRVLYFYYYVDGERYQGMTVTMNKDIDLSDQITIYYDKSDPSIISSDEIAYFEYYAIILGGIFILLGIGLINKTKKLKV